MAGDAVTTPAAKTNKENIMAMFEYDSSADGSDLEQSIGKASRGGVRTPGSSRRPMSAQKHCSDEIMELGADFDGGAALSPVAVVSPDAEVQKRSAPNTPVVASPAPPKFFTAQASDLVVTEVIVEEPEGKSPSPLPAPPMARSPSGSQLGLLAPRTPPPLPPLDENVTPSTAASFGEGSRGRIASPPRSVAAPVLGVAKAVTVSFDEAARTPEAKAAPPPPLGVGSPSKASPSKTRGGFLGKFGLGGGFARFSRASSASAPPPQNSVDTSEPGSRTPAPAKAKARVVNVAPRAPIETTHAFVDTC